MDSPSKILVINDCLDGIEAALGKAALIEHYTGAEVEVAEVIWDYIEEEPLPEAEKANLIEAFIAADRQALRNMLAPFQDRIAWSESRVLWNKRADKAILDEAGTLHADLLIKPVAERKLRDHLFAPLDWRLIREAPCPVLMSKASAWQASGKVLAAVDIADEKHAELTDLILRNAQSMREILDAELHVVSVYSDLGQSVNALQVAMDYEGIKQDMCESRTRALDEVLDRLGVSGATIHILEGRPALIIEKLAQQLRPAVTVMGTAARRGLGKLLIGNTAEDTLTRLTGDVLTVRADQP